MILGGLIMCIGGELGTSISPEIGTMPTFGVIPTFGVTGFESFVRGNESGET